MIVNKIKSLFLKNDESRKSLERHRELMELCESTKDVPAILRRGGKNNEQ